MSFLGDVMPYSFTHCCLDIGKEHLDVKPRDSIILRIPSLWETKSDESFLRNWTIRSNPFCTGDSELVLDI